MPTGLRMAIDIGPLFLFFGIYYVAGLITATGIYVVITLIALAIGYYIERRIAPMPLATAAIVTIFGTLTVVLNDKQFIFMKPTIVNGLFAAVLIVGLITKQPLLKMMFRQAMELTDIGWTKLTYRWTAFFIVMAIANEFVWRTFSEGFWVSYKLFGALPLIILFTLLQTPFIMRHQIPEKADPGDGAT